MTATDKTTRVLSNDDGWILSTYGPPISIEEIRDKMVGPHAGSPIDTFVWNVGGREVFSYETEIGERFAQDVETFDDPPDRTRAIRDTCRLRAPWAASVRFAKGSKRCSLFRRFARVRARIRPIRTVTFDPFEWRNSAVLRTRCWQGRHGLLPFPWWARGSAAAVRRSRPAGCVGAAGARNAAPRCSG